MATSILQIYLRLNVLDLGTDDSRFKKLELAAAQLADEFARDPKSALQVFLTVLSTEQCSEDDFAAVGSAIETHWATYHGAFQGAVATTLYKAVALQGLITAINLQPVLGTAISLLMRNFGPQLEVGKNKAALELLVNAADDVFEAQASELMVNPGDAQPITLVAVKPAKLDRVILQKRVDASVGSQNRAGQPGENPNPHWSNAANPWSHDYADRMTALLGDYLDNAATKAAEMDAKALATMANSINSIFQRQKDPSLRMTTSLLWWRQALYSQSADQSYRDLKPLAACRTFP